jgi:beta-phosphoglucomutase-like phosphatase (HAD superfamily)
VTDPGRPALFVDRFEAVVFDTDCPGVTWPTRRAARRSAGSATPRTASSSPVSATTAPRPFPASGVFVRRLRERGLRTAAVSASRNIVPVPKAAAVRDLFDAEVAGVQADGLGLAGRPDTALFLEAARRLGVAPTRAAVVEGGAQVVVADLGELALQGGPVRRGHR